MVLASVVCTDAGPAGSEGTGEGHRASGARYHRWVLVLVDERHIGGGEVRASASSPWSSSTSCRLLREAVGSCVRLADASLGR